jgi:hypothetical protein
MVARALVPALVLAFAVLAGCATHPPAETPPPLTPRPGVTPNFVVPDPTARMVHLAQQEWQLFGRPVAMRGGDGTLVVAFEGAATHEVQPPMLTRVLMYWYAVTRQPIVGEQGELRPWSAAFVSWLARGAGYTRDAFPSTVLHWDYIDASLAGRGAFAVRDPLIHPPRVGDLVCAPRGFRADFTTLRRGPYHCDLVVAVRAEALDTIGGNVGDVVALTPFPVDPRGLLLPSPERPWAVVLTPRAPRD